MGHLWGAYGVLMGWGQCKRGGVRNRVGGARKGEEKEGWGLIPKGAGPGLSSGRGADMRGRSLETKGWSLNIEGGGASSEVGGAFSGSW